MNKQNKISLILGVLVLTVLIVTSSFAYFQITNTDSSTDTNFSGELEDINDYGKSVLSGGIEGYHINILASDMAPSKIGTHYYGTIDEDSNYSLERKNYEISNVSIVEGVNNENVEYTCTSELSITLKGSLTQTKEDGSYYIQEGDGTLYLSGSKLRIDKSQIDLKEIIENTTENEEGTKEYKKTLTYIISKGNPGTLNVDFDIINRDVVQNDIAGKDIEITLRNNNLQCEVSGRKVYVDLDRSYVYSNGSNYGYKYRSKEYRDKIVSASFVNYVPNDSELENLTHWDLTNVNSSSANPNTSPAKSVIGWLEATKENSDQYNLYIGSTDTIYAIDLSNSFRQMANLQEINFENLNTSETITMSYMFNRCDSLTTLDLSSFDTSKVTNMSYMFSGDSYNQIGLEATIKFPQNFGSAATNMSHMFDKYQGTTLDLRNFDTSKVTDMNSMFKGCRNLTTLDLSTFDTSSVTDMGSMFVGSIKLIDLNLTGWNTSSVTNMNSMFSATQVAYTDGTRITDNMSLSNIIGIEKFNTKNVIDMSRMFWGCNKLKELSFENWPNFVTTNVEDMSYMFDNCSNLNYLNLGTFDVSKVKNMSYMFYSISANIIFPQEFGSFATDMSYMFYNYKGTTLDLSNFDTSQVTNMSNMFSQCTNLTELPFQNWSKFVTSNVENMSSMFESYKGTTLDLSSFDTSKVTNMGYMFYGCPNLKELPFQNWSKFVTSSVTDMSYMFYNYKGTTLDLSNFDTSQVTNMSNMFSQCTNLTELPFQNWSKFVTSNVENMSSMFESYKGTTLDLSIFDTSKVTNMSKMFSYCTNLTELPFQNWSKFITSNVESMSRMFESYRGTTLDLSSFDTSKVTNMSEMFYNCSKLTSLDLSSFTFDNVTKGTSSSGGNHITFYNVPSDCTVKINPSQLETFKDKFPLGTGTYDRKFRVPGEE